MSNQKKIIKFEPLLVWLLVVFLILFAFYISYDLGFLGQLIGSDLTRISLLILGIFSLTLCHCAKQSWFLAQQGNFLIHLREGNQNVSEYTKAKHQQPSLALEYWLSGASHSGVGEGSTREEVLAEKMRGGNQLGWFSAGLMIKFGLLGTVVGFAIMLGSINEVEALEVSDIKNLMQLMTEGMRVAMNTTIVGLITSILLGVQYFILDRYADRLVIEILEEPPEFLAATPA